jgi:hypothetical protein
MRRCRWRQIIPAPRGKSLAVARPRARVGRHHQMYCRPGLQPLRRCFGPMPDLPGDSIPCGSTASFNVSWKRRSDAVFYLAKGG